MKKIIIFIFLIFTLIFFCQPVFGIEEKPSLSSSKKELSTFATGLNFAGFDASAENIIKSIMLLVNTLFFIFMIYAGILWLVSSGNESKIEKAKSIIVWCVIGMAITLSSYAITVFILGKVG